MNKYPHPGGCKRGAIEIEEAVDMGLGRELGMQAASPEKIEREKGLGKESIPKVHGEVGSSGTEARNEMVFESADGSFCCIASVHMWG
jgi:hypothetical protein